MSLVLTTQISEHQLKLLDRDTSKTTSSIFFWSTDFKQPTSQIDSNYVERCVTIQKFSLELNVRFDCSQCTMFQVFHTKPLESSIKCNRIVLHTCQSYINCFFLPHRKPSPSLNSHIYEVTTVSIGR